MYQHKIEQSKNIKEKELKREDKDLKPKFQYLPYKKFLRKNNENIQNGNGNNQSNKLKNCEVQKSNILKSPRNLLFITGKIEFCLNIRKLYPNNSILFGVYGNILKITNGKYKLQHIILLRNNIGPVLQVIFYKFLSSPVYTIGQKIYCVGRFTGQANQMQIYKIKEVLEIPNDEVLNRIRNVCNFSLKKNKLT